MLRIKLEKTHETHKEPDQKVSPEQTFARQLRLVDTAPIIEECRMKIADYETRIKAIQSSEKHAGPEYTSKKTEALSELTERLQGKQRVLDTALHIQQHQEEQENKYIKSFIKKLNRLGERFTEALKPLPEPESRALRERMGTRIMRLLSQVSELANADPQETMDFPNLFLHLYAYINTLSNLSAESKHQNILQLFESAKNIMNDAIQEARVLQLRSNPGIVVIALSLMGAGTRRRPVGDAPETTAANAGPAQPPRL
jgi:hypothetical protein